MKKCLITGACGTVGYKLLSKLLNTNEYEITVLDLKNSKSVKKLNKFKDKINIIYGDLNDDVILRALIKDHDIIFHLAGIIPPMSEIHPNLTNIVEYGGSVALIDAIKELNPKAYLVYLSTTSIYGNSELVNLKSDIQIYNHDIFSQNKYKVEDYIKKNLKNYTIYRVPLIIDKNEFNSIFYNIPLNSKIEVITNSLVANALVTSLKNRRKLNKQTFILAGGKNYRTTVRELYVNVLKVHGISFKYILMRHFVPQNFYGHFYEDDSLNKILDYQKGSINDVYKNFNKKKKFKRCLNRFLAYISIIKLNKKYDIEKEG